MAQMTHVESKLLMNRVRARRALVTLQLQEPAPDRDEAIHVLREYIGLMTTPIDPNQTRGRVV